MTTKEKLQLKKINLLINIAYKKGNIEFFDEEFYAKLRDYYHGSTPASFFIKFFNPSLGIGPGMCFERSLVISSIFEDAKLVRGNRIDYSIYHGDGSFHWWVESDGWCYDPSAMCRYKKEEYYKIFKPINLIEMNKDEITNCYYYKNMIHPYPKEELFIINLIQLEEQANILNQLGDDEATKELEIFKEKIHYYDTKTDEEILTFIRNMKTDVMSK